MTRIGVFYDGNYFAHVSNYYNYEHKRKSRLSLDGLHKFIRCMVSEHEEQPLNLCQIVDIHYHRSRLSVHDYPGDPQSRVMNERIFDDILMSAGVTTHYTQLGMKDGHVEDDRTPLELSMNALGLSYLKSYDVVVLVVSDSSYTVLVNALSTLGIRAMVLGWNFSYVDTRTGKRRDTVTSKDLLNKSTYRLTMESIINSEDDVYEDLIDDLFVTKELSRNAVPSEVSTDGQQFYRSTVLSLKSGYGFISKPPNNLYFHATWMEDEREFTNLNVGDTVFFTISHNDQGQEIAVNVTSHNPIQD